MKLSRLHEEAERAGKPIWRPMLKYAARLHEASIHPARAPFPYPWEEIGPGYCYGPAFGHWDIVHAVLDSLASEPEHAKRQLLNNLAAQQPDGLVPGSIWMREAQAGWNGSAGHPSVWPVAIGQLYERTGDLELVERGYAALQRLLGWYENRRKAVGEGYFYTDILNRQWESGVDEGARFDDSPRGAFACVDATSHVFWLYRHAAAWAELLGADGEALREKADRLAAYIRRELYDSEAGYFYDSWSVHARSGRTDVFEGMWPLVAGAALREQAERVIDGYLLNPDKFFTRHPLATIAVDSPKFELRMWRGPAWNSMTYWAATGCMRYGRPDAAAALLEAGLDETAAQFERTGTLWEFYHPHGGSPLELQRKPDTPYNAPCRDYLGHNPVLAMARLWEEAAGEAFASGRRHPDASDSTK